MSIIWWIYHAIESLSSCNLKLIFNNYFCFFTCNVIFKLYYLNKLNNFTQNLISYCVLIKDSIRKSDHDFVIRSYLRERFIYTVFLYKYYLTLTYIISFYNVNYKLEWDGIYTFLSRRILTKSFVANFVIKHSILIIFVAIFLYEWENM